MTPDFTSRRVRTAIAVSAAWLLVSAAAASAQPSFDATISGSFDRVARATGSESDASSAPAGTLNLEHLALEEKLRLFYALDGGTFTGDGDWHYVTHVGGARHAFDLPAGARLFVGGTATARLNGDSWSAANYSGVGAFSNLQWTRDTSTLRTGIRFDARRFADEAALDQNEINVFGSALVNFQSRTTLIGEISWGTKRFLDGALVSAEPLASPPGPLEDATTGTGGAQVGGSGRGNSGMGNAGAPGAGAAAAAAARAAMQQGMWRSVYVTTSSGSDGPARQVTLFGRVAQSLADRVALSFEASRRNAGSVVAPAVIETPEMLIDDGVYDDPFASDATTWRTGVKYAGASGRIVEGGFSRWLKFYEATPALDANGVAVPGVMRDDTVWRFDATWREPIAQSRTGLVSLALVATYSFMDSSSTDAYYNYDAHRFRVGVSVGY